MSTLSDAIESSKCNQQRVSRCPSILYSYALFPFLALTYEVLLADYEALQAAHTKKTNDEERLST